MDQVSETDRQSWRIDQVSETDRQNWRIDQASETDRQSRRIDQDKQSWRIDQMSETDRQSWRIDPCIPWLRITRGKQGIQYNLLLFPTVHITVYMEVLFFKSFCILASNTVKLSGTQMSSEIG